MIVCPQCSNTLKIENAELECVNCHTMYGHSEGTTKLITDDDLNDDYDYEAYLAEITKIKEAEDIHFWFRHRNRMILTLFKKYVTFQNECIEIGAGTGSITQFLNQEGYNVAVGEIHPTGIRYAQEKKIIKIYQFDIRKNPFRSEFDVVAMFDVLEHIKDDKAALNNVRDMLKTKGKIILAVPAHMWLWCKDDEVSQHLRRYELKELKDLLAKTGFKVLAAKNMFFLILPLLYLRAKLKFYSDEIKINPILNCILDQLCRLEGFLSEKLHWQSTTGGTIFVVAQKFEHP